MQFLFELDDRSLSKKNVPSHNQEKRLDLSRLPEKKKCVQTNLSASLITALFEVGTVIFSYDLVSPS